jgi:signal transduction histidine kinase
VRTRIALDLHDDVAGSLSRMAILSEVAARLSAQGQDVSQRLAELASTAREMVGAVSDVVWSADPRRDDLGSLLARLRAYGTDLLEEAGVALRLDALPDAAQIRLAPEQRRHLYLILKEALTNAARHSGARKVEVRLAREGQRLRAEVQDDGRGLPAAPPGGLGGNGLRNMEARARDAGGSLQLTSTPGGGTRVAVELPVRMSMPWRRRAGR